MNALRKRYPIHWPEYWMEAAGLGLFLVAASLATALFEYPASPVHQAIASPELRRLLIGIAMGLTAIALIYSPWGQQSGAHLNPAVTLTFFRLGKVRPLDALAYVTAQFIGGWLGIALMVWLLGPVMADPRINYIVTQPGVGGVLGAWLAELAISWGLMIMVLIVSNHPRLGRWTGLFSGLLIAVYITLEAPLSGMSMNPARSLASAVAAHDWTALWIYFTAPLGGMLLAAELYGRWQGRAAVQCAKLNHATHRRCIFNCGYRGQGAVSGSRALSDTLPRF